MRVIICVVVSLIGVMGTVFDAAAAEESLSKVPSTSSLRQYTPATASQASESKRATVNVDRTIGICQMISNPPTPSKYPQNTLNPSSEVRFYFRGFEHLLLEGASRVSILEGPARGELIDEGTFVKEGLNGPLKDTGERTYYLSAEAGYVGRDSVTFLVEIGNYRIKLIYFFHMFGSEIDDDTVLTKKLCPNGEYKWKISLKD